MHTVWKGALSFGLVHVPVKMFTATEDRDIRFRTIHKACGNPISHIKTCTHCNEEVGADDVAKGFEYEKGRFVLFNEDEIDALKPESARTIQILDFVDLTDIDPIYFEKAYYLSPDMAGSGAYSLLLEAIRQTGKIGVAKISIRSKSSLAAVRVVENCLCLETMHFPDEIRSVEQVPPANFTGVARVERLFAAVDPARASGGLVHFEAGAREQSHQILDRALVRHEFLQPTERDFHRCETREGMEITGGRKRRSSSHPLAFSTVKIA